MNYVFHNYVFVLSLSIQFLLVNFRHYINVYYINMCNYNYNYLSKF